MRLLKRVCCLLTAVLLVLSISSMWELLRKEIVKRGQQC